MTDRTTKILLDASAEQFLLGEQEQAFIAACDKICVVVDGADGWPSIRFLRPEEAKLEALNSRAVRLRAEALAPGHAAAPKKVALLLIRIDDGQHLVLHGHVVPSHPSSAEEDNGRVWISVATRCWSPDICSGPDPSLARALRQN
jgi:hypothetical protein